MKADIAVFPEMWNTGYEMIFEGDLKEQDNIPQEKIDKYILNLAESLKLVS